LKHFSKIKTLKYTASLIRTATLQDSDSVKQNAANHKLTVLISMVVCGRHSLANQPLAALERDPRDIEMDHLRRQIQQLQEYLELYEASKHDAPPRGSNVKASCDDGENVIPFH
jgi:hypothetical protein